VSTSCTDCALCESRTQVVFPTPCPPGGLLAIGEAPGADEDAAGEGFVGSAGKRLDMLLGIHKLERGRHYGVANICRCRPPDNRKPREEEIAACLPKLVQAILDIHPKVLLLVGGVPTNAFLRPGPLNEIIAEHGETGYIDPTTCRQEILPLVDQGIRAIPCPHSSGLAWFRKSPSGLPWNVIGVQQIQIAVDWL